MRKLFAKRILAMFLAVMMVLSIMPASVFATDLDDDSFVSMDTSEVETQEVPLASEEDDALAIPAAEDIPISAEDAEETNIIPSTEAEDLDETDEVEEIAVSSEEALDAQPEENSGNHSPEIVSGARNSAHIKTGSPWSINVVPLFNDQDGDPLEYTATFDGVAVPISGNVLTINPSAVGVYSLVITAADDEAVVDHTITVTVGTTNAAPSFVGDDAVTNGRVEVGEAYLLTDLQNGLLFSDEDALNYTNYTYKRYVNAISGEAEEHTFSPAEFGSTTIHISENSAGVYWYVFRATDGQEVSTTTWTLKLNVGSVEGYTFYVGKDQNYATNGGNYPIIKLYKTAGHNSDQVDYIATYTDSGNHVHEIFDPTEITYSATDGKYYCNGFEVSDYLPIDLTDSSFSGAVVTNGVLENNYNKFYAAITNGEYSFRAYGKSSASGSYDVYLGGHSLILPTDVNVDGTAGGGNNIYLRLHSINATNQDGTKNFTEDEYYVTYSMPLFATKAKPGTAYTVNGIYYYPCMMYAAGNALVYDIFAKLKDGVTGYVTTQKIEQTAPVSYEVLDETIVISAGAALNVTVPANSTFQLFFQNNNYNTVKVEPSAHDSNNYTFAVSKNSGKYTWRLTDNSGNYVTKAGWLASVTSDSVNLTLNFAGSSNNKKSHSFDNLGSTVSQRDEAEIQVYLTDSGFKSTTGTERVRAFRLWQIIDSDAMNVMIEPKFNFQVLSGNSGDIAQHNGGNAEGNWIDVTPTTTDIVAVTYDALDVYAANGSYGTHGGLFPATNPERAGVFVISNAASGSADAVIAYNANNGANARPANWDYNYDTWFYLASDPTLQFTVTGNPSSVQYATVTTNSNLVSTLSEFAAVTRSGDSCTVNLSAFDGTNGGTVIIKMHNADGDSYRLVRVAKVTANITNLTSGGETFMPGDQIQVQFDGSYRGIYKYSGIFNPTSYILRYSDQNGTEYSATVSQYRQMDSAALNLTIPNNVQFADGADTATYSFTNGYTFGSMYSAVQPFATLYNMTDTGVGTNFNAAMVSFCLNHFPDLPITVQQKVFYTVKVNPTFGGADLTGCTITLTDSTGAAQTQNADGNFEYLSYGTYNYVISKTGYVTNRGSFTLDETDAGSVVSGILTKNIAMTQSAANAWDGTTKTMPTLNGDVYQIGTGAELAWFANAVNTGSTTAKAALTADIDLGGYQWTPIGTSANKFAGSFDGQGHTIDGLYINYSGTNTTSPYKGLFGSVNGSSASAKAQIKNFTLNGEMTLTATGNVLYAYSGAVAGLVNNTNVQNVHSNVDVTVNRVGGFWRYAGGVIGRANSSTVTRCSYNGTLRCYQYSGGVAGYIDASTTLSQCCNTGTVIGTSTYIGGVVGQSLGTVQTSYNSGSVSGAGSTGGVVGQTTKTVLACYNAGPVNGTGNYVGGVVGFASGATASVSNCFNVGSITASSATYTGAVIGYMNNASATAAHLYYLDTSYTKGIGSAAGNQTATAKLSGDFVNRQFANTYMNVGIAANTFRYKAGVSYPILNWQ